MLLGFKPQFVEPIEKGSKIHTFRKNRKHHPKDGEKLFMYTGLRTSNCKKILGERYLVSSQKVRMVIKRLPNGTLDCLIHIGSKREFDMSERYWLAIQDGFKHYGDFLNYWIDGKDKVVFSGYCHHWTSFSYN